MNLETNEKKKLSYNTLKKENFINLIYPKSFISLINKTYQKVVDYRKSLDLTNPGSIENINKEVSRDVFLTQYAFSGFKADINKAFSMSPAFQTSHSLSIGSGFLPPYSFSALYATDDYFLQGSIDNDFSFSGRLNYGWNKNNISKLTLQFLNNQPSMIQMEQDYQSSDFSLNLKTLNPSFHTGNFSGVIVCSLLQSITKKLALGIETMYSDQVNSVGPDSSLSYILKYNAGNWISLFQLQAQGVFISSFWRKITDKVEAGLETQISASISPINDSLTGSQIGFQPIVEGQTTIAAKYEYRQSIFRGQLDSSGKVSAFLEKRILPTLSILFSGEINHANNQSKLGLGLQFESAGNEKLMMVQQGLVDVNGNLISPQPFN